LQYRTYFQKYFYLTRLERSPCPYPLTTLERHITKALIAVDELRGSRRLVDDKISRKSPGLVCRMHSHVHRSRVQNLVTSRRESLKQAIESL